VSSTLPHFRSFPDALHAHWPLYLYEAAELAAFMVSACLFTILLFHPAVTPIHNPALARTLMGVAMGLTAIAIIKSPWGVRSGAHFNPAITLTFYRLGKIGPYDTCFYVIAHFVGAIAGVGAAALIAPVYIAAPQVNYAVTVPGPAGTLAAFAAETFMAALLLAVVLITSNHPRLAPYTTYLMGVLIATYVLFFAPISGYSINPARTVGSAVFAHLYTALWIYFAAPLLGMLTAAESYLRLTSPHHQKHYFRHRHLTQHP
jgi:aquaporin Z